MNNTNLSLQFLIDSVWQRYRIHIVTLHQIVSASGKRIYQTELADGTYRTLRITEDLSEATLTELAKLLIFFKQQNYPAERIILTKEQTTIAAMDNWRLCMTTFLIGTSLEYTPIASSLLGAVLGQLHALKPSPTYTPPQADMLPVKELAFAQQQLTAIAHIVPKQFIAQTGTALRSNILAHALNKRPNPSQTIRQSVSEG